MTYRLDCLDSRSNMVFVELEGDGSHPLLHLKVDQRGRFADVKLYAIVRMTLQEMADLLPHRAARATSSETVHLWGRYRNSSAAWTGIRDWRRSPLRSFLLPHVAEAIGDRIDDEGSRALLHFTGFLDWNADAIETMRFFAQARHS